MKNLFAVIIASLVSVALFAQNDVTTFLGIPVDGTKSAMIQKLKAKGFTYDATYDMLEGEFNGQPVYVYLVTDNNKVYRICVFDKNETSQSQIKIRFNTLCHQFERNGKYLPVKDNQEIDESEDISYEMLVHQKEYQASFYQVGPGGVESFYNKSLEEIEQLSNKVVWFAISERYGKYIIVMYYDNYKNQSNGEDL
ncbi:MAG: hypothetical protein II859_07395 [Bacteroidales bacterium]|nr:hypothetical protein [Bacteroidales bacterium]